MSRRSNPSSDRELHESREPGLCETVLSEGIEAHEFLAVDEGRRFSESDRCCRERWQFGRGVAGTYGGRLTDCRQCSSDVGISRACAVGIGTSVADSEWLSSLVSPPPGYLACGVLR